MPNLSNDTPQNSVGNYLLDCLHSYGVENIFGIPGDYVLQFDKLIEMHPSIKYIGATRESTAGYMADAYARLTGLGVVCITYGVGIEVANALSQAFAESSPIVIISGTAGTDEFERGNKLHHFLNKRSIFHQMDTTQFEIFSHCTIDKAVLTCPKEAKEQIDRVLWNCLKHQKPVYIEIPRNIALQPLSSQHQGMPSTTLTHSHTPQSTPNCRAATLKPLLDEIEKILKESHFPIIWAGHEILRYNLSKSLLKFAEKYQIPIVSTLLGKTVIDEHHPLSHGVYLGKISLPSVSELMDKADCLIQLGALLGDVDTGLFTAKLDYPHKICANASEITIDNENYHGVDFSDLIQALAESSFDLNRQAVPILTVTSKKTISFAIDHNAKINSKRLFECIASQLTSDHIITVDFGDSLFGTSEFILSENSFLSNAYYGSIGFGTPAAIGAQLACPNRRTIGIIGDGAFQMTATELSTAVRYQLDPIIIILNNHGYGIERPLLEGIYNDIHNWNYSQLPSFINGGKGIKVQTESEFDTAFKKALKQRGQFFLIEVDLKKTDFSPALERFFACAKMNHPCLSRDNGGSM